MQITTATKPHIRMVQLKTQTVSNSDENVKQMEFSYIINGV